MNLPEAARLLKVSEATLRRWVRQGLVGQGGPRGDRFERQELMRWARERGLSVGRAERHALRPPADLLADAVDSGRVLEGVRPAHASEAIELCVNSLSDVDPERRARLMTEVLDRERMASTAMGHGVALPHPRRPPTGIVSSPIVVVCFPEGPIDWAALDGEPVHTAMLLLSPSAPVHLELLARIAFVLRSPDFPAFLRERPGTDALVARLRELKKRTE